MSVISDLEPKRVWYYFEKISEIPRGSYHTEQISNYLVTFAKEHGLTCRKDASNNVIIKKPASQGYEQVPAVILQGHCDMVCEKKPGSSHDFSKDPLVLKREGDFVFAEDTTLGGDDGIAVAYMLAILEDDTLKHPAIEAVITTDEEVGLLGAKALDCSDLKGSYLLNLDSEEDGYLWISCAGGLRGDSVLPMKRMEVEGTSYQIRIDGLKGGHSGAEIDKNRASAAKLAGRFLHELRSVVSFGLIDLESGSKDNAIPREATMRIILEEAEEGTLKAAAEEFQKCLRKEYAGSDEGICVTIQKESSDAFQMLHPISREKLIFFLINIPYGVQKMSGVIENLVETSMNPGIVKLEEDFLKVGSSIRSSVQSAKETLSDQVGYLTEFLGGEYEETGDYPAWEFRKDSVLRPLMAEIYQEMFGKEPKVVAIHAGLECGLFSEKLEDMDAVSFGPDILDIHTTEERMSISSVERTWSYLLNVLERLKK